MLNILTIDLEDYFMVSAFEGVVKREDWDKYESRIEHNTHRLLNILNGSFRNPQSAIRNPVRATFFCLGWVAERYPHLIREIHQQGHEIGCHSYDHRLVYGMTPDEFREDIRKSKRLLEDAIGAEVIGYRAPSYSITKNSLWAFEVLIEEGFKYDSSIFPIRHDRYGIPGWERFPHILQGPGQGLHEFPLSTWQVWGLNLPIAGGGYLRHLPYALTHNGILAVNKGGHPVVIYLHPWEFDREQPREALSPLTSFRHYHNLGEAMEKKLKLLLHNFSFAPLAQVLGV